MIHPTADVASNDIGENTSIWQFTVILKNAKIGSNCNINAHCFIENDVVIGDNVTIKCGNYIWDGFTIEDNVFIGPNVTLTNDKVPISRNQNFKPIQTKLSKGCSIGGGAVLLPGITVGQNALIGAGSVVTKDVEPFTVVAGNPAKIVGYINEKGEIRKNQ